MGKIVVANRLLNFQGILWIIQMPIQQQAKNVVNGHP